MACNGVGGLGVMSPCFPVLISWPRGPWGVAFLQQLIYPQTTCIVAAKLFRVWFN
jgi:hypothetical protein